MSKIKHILSVIHYTICGAVYFQFTHFSCDDWENIFTLSYYHHQIGSMNYYPLFRVRSWNNGVCCMSFYILMGVYTQPRHHFQQCIVLVIFDFMVYSFFIEISSVRRFSFNPKKVLIIYINTLGSSLLTNWNINLGNCFSCWWRSLQKRCGAVITLSIFCNILTKDAP